MIVDTLARLDTLTPVPQRHEAATLAPRLKKTDGALDWRRPARDLVNLVRGCNPWPGATTPTAGGTLTLWRARTVAGAGAPGTLVAHERTLAIAAGEDAVLPLEVQPESRRAVGWDEFLRGARLGRRPPPRDAVSAAPGRRPARREDAARRPASARAVAAHVLERVESDAAFADLALDAELRRRALPPRDAALATELVYGTLRWQRYLDWILAPHSRRRLPALDARVRVLLRLTAYQLAFLERVPAFAAVNDAVSLARRCPRRGRVRQRGTARLRPPRRRRA